LKIEDFAKIEIFTPGGKRGGQGWSDGGERSERRGGGKEGGGRPSEGGKRCLSLREAGTYYLHRKLFFT
jgi:hypothetical protein